MRPIFGLVGGLDLGGKATQVPSRSQSVHLHETDQMSSQPEVGLAPFATSTAPRSAYIASGPGIRHLRLRNIFRRRLFMLPVVSRREEGRENVAVYQAVALAIHARPHIVRAIETKDGELSALS